MQINSKMKSLTLSVMLGMGGSIVSADAIGLKNSIPYANQTIQAGNQEIILKYDDEFNPFRSRLLLFGKKGEPKLIPATTSLDHKEVKTTYPLQAGHYKLQWQIWTWKGDKSSGEIPFTVVGTMPDPSLSNANSSPAPVMNGHSGNANIKQSFNH